MQSGWATVGMINVSWDPKKLSACPVHILICSWDHLQKVLQCGGTAPKALLLPFRFAGDSSLHKASRLKTNQGWKGSLDLHLWVSIPLTCTRGFHLRPRWCWHSPVYQKIAVWRLLPGKLRDFVQILHLPHLDKRLASNGGDSFKEVLRMCK